MRVFGIILAVALGAVFLVNAVFMLISPRRWLKLPYISLHGSANERWIATFGGQLQVRITGLLFLAFFVWLLTDMLSSASPVPVSGAPAEWPYTRPLSLILGVACCGGGVVIGLRMMLAPRKCFDKQIAPGLAEKLGSEGLRIPGVQTALIRFIWVSGLVVVVVSAYMGWDFVASWLKAGQ